MIFISKKGKRKFKRAAVAISLALVSLFVLLAIFVFVYARWCIDFEYDEALFSAAQNNGALKLYYDAFGYVGEDINKYEPIEYATLKGSDVRRAWYPYSEISDYVKRGFIAAEDREFSNHNGVNIKRTLGAFLNYVFRRDTSFGGSTITQQVIKNISGKSEKSAKRKFEEILRAYHLEQKYTKEEIFELYLNIAPMGENMSGVGIASRVYFGKEPSELSLAEAATLVGITNAPTRYNPRKFPVESRKKRDVILGAMHTVGSISDEEYREALSEPLSVIPESFAEDEINSWFTETVCDDIARDLVDRCGYSYAAARLLILNGGLSVYTTVDPVVQGILEDYFENKSNLPNGILDGMEMSMAVSDSQSAALRGIVGAAGKKRANRVVNYATQNVTPGSVLKPIALYAPLINAGRISWATAFDDVPVSFSTANDGSIVEYPRNSPAVYDGLINVADALARSKNTVAVRLYEMLGADKIYEILKNGYGFDSLVKSERKKNGATVTDLAPSPLALGQLSYGVPLRKITEAYTVFPNGGELNRGRSYTFLFDSEGNTVFSNPERAERMLSRDAAAVMTRMLSGVIDHGTARAVRLGEYVDVAGKTGTSGGGRDKLFIGYTPYYTAGIWCGYPKTSARVPNSERNHLTVWDEVMKRIHTATDKYGDQRHFSSHGLLYLPFCKDSGKLYQPVCTRDVRGSRLAYGYFIRGTEPRDGCERHRLCSSDEIDDALLAEQLRSQGVGFIALLDIPERSFPKDIEVTDAPFVYKRRTENSEDADMPPPSPSPFWDLGGVAEKRKRRR